MFDLDKWQEILGTMRKNKLRTFLTGFGVFWGIFMLVLLLGAGQGLQNGVMNGFGGVYNSIWIWPGRTTMPYAGLQPGRVIKMQNGDVEALRRELPNIDLLAVRNRLNGEYTINWKAKTASYQVFGANTDFFIINGEKLYNGRMINTKDEEEKRKVIIIGKRVSKVLFGEDYNPIGEYVSIKGVYFQVVGLFRTDANEGRNEERVYMPMSTLQTTFNQPNQIQLISLTPKYGVVSAELTRQVSELMFRRHKVAPDDKQAIGVSNEEEDYNRTMGLFTGINVFVGVIGVFTLLAGVVGVSNIMLIIVKERTKEIGVRKAIGATPISIISLIIQESVVITGFAGYMGLLVGVGLLDLMRFAMESSGAEMPFFKNPGVNMDIMLIATLILVASGALAGLVPAAKAANIKPIEALRAD